MSASGWTVAFPGLRGGNAVWLVDLGLTEGTRGSCAALLSADEQARAARFLRSEDRDRFIASHAALRLILAGQLGADPGALDFVAGPAGKPDLRPPWAGRMQFNLSHSGDLALVGIADTARIGVDIEAARPMSDQLRIARAHFAAQEIAALEALAPAAVPAAFLSCWTRKEAVVKALGGGLSLPLDRFAVSIPPAPAAILHLEGEPGGWTLHHLAPAAGYVGAVAIAAAHARCDRLRLPPDWPDRLAR